MSHANSFLLRCSFIFLAAFTRFGTAEVVRQPHIEAELVSERATLKWGETFSVAVRLKMDSKWHTYWRNPGDSGEPIHLKWNLPEGFTASEIQWPWPKRIEVPPLANFGFDDEVFLISQVMVPGGKGDSTVPLRVKASWLVCESTCIPGSADLALSLPVGATGGSDSPWKPRFDEARAKLPVVKIDWDASWTAVGDDALELKISGVKENIQNAYFFPNEGSQIEHAAAQRFSQDPAGITLRLQKNVHYEANKSMDGVLVVKAPGEIGVELNLTSGKSAKAKTGWLESILFAFLGGMILNLMPCVFPVLFIKVLSFTSLAGADRRKVLAHSGAYAFGILVSFWILAGLLLALRASGEQLGWGFQLQSPVFLASLAFLLLALSLNLLGTFEIGTTWMGVGQGLAAKSGWAGSFFSGVLATVVATPCTAPFMGSAMGFALTQPPIAALSVFTSLGLGLAFPYVLFSGFPQLTRRLPRPGVWMETFKQAMAFPLLATLLWLLWVLGLQIGLDEVVRLMTAMLGVSFILWAYGKPSRRPQRKAIVCFVFLAACLAWSLKGIYRAGADTGANAKNAAANMAEGWAPFSEDALAKALGEGKSVFIDFTAAWCITCQVNERVVLSLPSIKSKFAEKNVVLFKADWTNQNEEISKRLDGYGRNGVPLYVLYRKGDKDHPTILPQILTPEGTLEELNRL